MYQDTRKWLAEARLQEQQGIHQKNGVKKLNGMFSSKLNMQTFDVKTRI